MEILWLPCKREHCHRNKTQTLSLAQMKMTEPLHHLVPHIFFATVCCLYLLTDSLVTFHSPVFQRFWKIAVSFRDRQHWSALPHRVPILICHSSPHHNNCCDLSRAAERRQGGAHSANITHDPPRSSRTDDPGVSPPVPWAPPSTCLGGVFAQCLLMSCLAV